MAKLARLGTWLNQNKKLMAVGGLNIGVFLVILVLVSIGFGLINIKLGAMVPFLWLYLNIAYQDLKKGTVRLVSFVFLYGAYFFVYMAAWRLFGGLLLVLSLGYLVNLWARKRGLLKPELRAKFSLGMADVLGIPPAVAGLAYLGLPALVAGSLGFAALWVARQIRRRPSEESVRLLPLCWTSLLVGFVVALLFALASLVGA
jgi:hypothetical protein